MPKNCHNCERLEWVDGDSDSTSGWDCMKRHTCPMDEKKEAALLAQLDSDAYRNRHKRCFEPMVEVTA